MKSTPSKIKVIGKIPLTACLSLLLFGVYSCDSVAVKRWLKTGSSPENYEVGIDKTEAVNGQKSAFLLSDSALSEQFGTLMQSVGAKEYQGKKIRMTGFIKSENVKDWSGMWLRIDDYSGVSSTYFDNMEDRPIKGNTDWTEYEILMDVPKDGYSMNFGVLLVGQGKVWLDDVKFEIIGESMEAFSDTLTTNQPYPFSLRPENLDFEE
ncbi:MAG: hypothetical protein AAF039_18410 [Bacteroidota bacterium]